MGSHYEKLGLQRISCGSQPTIPNMADTSPHAVGNDTVTRSSKPNLASCTTDFSSPLVSSILFPSSSSISLSRPQLYYYHKNTKLSHPCQSLHPMIKSSHRVQHTPSTAYTEYSIHRVQHTPSTAYTKYSIH